MNTMNLNPGSDAYVAAILWIKLALQSTQTQYFYKNHLDYIWRGKSLAHYEVSWSWQVLFVVIPLDLFVFILTHNCLKSLQWTEEGAVQRTNQEQLKGGKV